MTWMIIKLVLSLVFVAAVLLLAAKVAKKRGLGGPNAVIEVVARQRMGRASSVAVLRIADRVLVVGATDEHITLLGEVDAEAVEEILAPGRVALAVDTDGYDDGLPAVPRRHRPATPASGGPIAGSVLDRGAWTSLVAELRERTVRR